MSVRAIIMLGLLSWSLRYGLLAYGNAGTGMWMFYLAILLHGVCFDFFFMTGQLYADQEAPDNLARHGSGFSDLRDLWHRDVHRVAALRRRAGLVHDDGRRQGSPPVDEFLAELGHRVGGDPADGGAVLPEPEPDPNEEGLKEKRRSLTRAPALGNPKRK